MISSAPSRGSYSLSTVGLEVVELAIKFSATISPVFKIANIFGKQNNFFSKPCTGVGMKLVKRENRLVKGNIT